MIIDKRSALALLKDGWIEAQSDFGLAEDRTCFDFAPQLSTRFCLDTFPPPVFYRF